jgi:hypothetical protein
VAVAVVVVVTRQAQYQFAAKVIDVRKDGRP